MSFFDSLLRFLDVLVKVCVSVSTTQTGFTYSVTYSVPTDIGLYFSSRLVEVRNFSSVFTGISKKIEMNTTFQETSGNTPSSVPRQLYIVNATTSLLSNDASNFVGYQKDFYNFMVSRNSSMFAACPSYFQDCSTLTKPYLTSKISSTDETTQQFFIINQMLKNGVSSESETHELTDSVSCPNCVRSENKGPRLETHRLLSEVDSRNDPHHKQRFYAEYEAVVQEQRNTQHNQISQTPTAPLSLSFTATGLVEVAHFSLSTSFFYLLVLLGVTHSSVLIYGILDLKRNPSLNHYALERGGLGPTGRQH